jgi:hypothetical protein
LKAPIVPWAIPSAPSVTPAASAVLVVAWASGLPRVIEHHLGADFDRRHAAREEATLIAARPR